MGEYFPFYPPPPKKGRNRIFGTLKKICKFLRKKAVFLDKFLFWNKKFPLAQHVGPKKKHENTKC